MKNKLFPRLTSALCAFALLLSLLPAAQAAEAPAKTSNINKQDYTSYAASTVKSYLYANDSGGLTRVEYDGKSIIVEDYDSAFQMTGSRTVPMELSIWGGFFAGEDANYLIFGQNNPSQSNSTEVIRVVKYSKDWQRQSQTSVKGANTVSPFDAGSLRCDEYGGYLYVHTCHKMYTNKDDGLQHQSNLTLQIKESDMTLADSFYDVWCVDWGYISHSFNQFILIDQDRHIVTLDQSDSDSLTMGANYSSQKAAARGAMLIRYDKLYKAGESKFTNQRSQKWCSFTNVQKFAGSSGSNATGASLGGFAETAGGYVSAYNYDGKAGTGPRDVYLGYTAKSGLKNTVKKVSTASGTTAPVLASNGLDGGYILWNGKDGGKINDTLYYASCSDGGTVGKVQTAKAPLSDCQPISYNGKLVWYVTNNSAPVFYGLDASGVKTLSGSAAPGESAKPTAPTTPTAPSTGTKYTGIISDGYFYFSECGAILSDGTLKSWYHHDEVNGKSVMDNYDLITAGTGYLSGNPLNLLKSDGTLWYFDTPNYYQDLYLVATDVKQSGVNGKIILKNDGTVRCTRTPSGDYASFDQDSSYITSNAKQVVETIDNPFDSTFYVLKNDGTLWSWSANRERTTYPFLGRGNGKSGGAMGKVMDNVAFAAPGMAIKTDGTLWSWGAAMTVGNGSGEDVYSPVKIMNNVVGAWASPDGNHRFALTSDGALYSWGLNSENMILGYAGGNKTKTLSRGGNLGYADYEEWTVTYQSVPQKVDIDNAVAVEATMYGSALMVEKSDGSLWATGNVGGLPCRTVEAGEEEIISTFRKVLDGVKLPTPLSAATTPAS